MLGLKKTSGDLGHYNPTRAQQILREALKQYQAQNSQSPFAKLTYDALVRGSSTKANEAIRKLTSHPDADEIDTDAVAMKKLLQHLYQASLSYYKQVAHEGYPAYQDWLKGSAHSDKALDDYCKYFAALDVVTPLKALDGLDSGLFARALAGQQV